MILRDIGDILGVPMPHTTKQIIFHQKFMPIKYVNEKTGKFIVESLKDTGAPSRYGILTAEDLVATSLSMMKDGQAGDIFFLPQKL